MSDVMDWVRYKGPLGTFSFDPEQFVVVKRRDGAGREVETLRYIGFERDGRLIQIPDGIVDMSYMFEHKSLMYPPAIPKSVKRAMCAFAGCISLAVAPVLPDGMENISMMLMGCRALTIGMHLPGSVTDAAFLYENCLNLSQPGTLSEGLLNATGMYRGCRALLSKPEIPDSVIETEGMFVGCEAVNNGMTKMF